jgi:hypothetical protein
MGVETTGEGAEGCPDAGQLVELARGRLGPAERESVSAHVRACAERSEVAAPLDAQSIPRIEPHRPARVRSGLARDLARAPAARDGQRSPILARVERRKKRGQA